MVKCLAWHVGRIIFFGMAIFAILLVTGLLLWGAIALTQEWGWKVLLVPLFVVCYTCLQIYITDEEAPCGGRQQ